MAVSGSGVVLRGVGRRNGDIDLHSGGIETVGTESHSQIQYQGEGNQSWHA